MPPFLTFFNSKDLFTIQEVKSQLHENWEYYRDIRDRWECSKCATQIGLPCICAKPDQEWIFIHTYEALDKLAKSHRKESEMKEVMREYNSILFSNIDHKNWVAKHEKLALEDCLSFEFDYLDYPQTGNGEKHLRVIDSELSLAVLNSIRKASGRIGLKEKSDYEIYVNRQDFKYTIDFIKAFNENY